MPGLLSAGGLMSSGLAPYLNSPADWLSMFANDAQAPLPNIINGPFPDPQSASLQTIGGFNGPTIVNGPGSPNIVNGSGLPNIVNGTPPIATAPNYNENPYLDPTIPQPGPQQPPNYQGPGYPQPPPLPGPTTPPWYAQTLPSGHPAWYAPTLPSGHPAWYYKPGTAIGGAIIGSRPAHPPGHPPASSHPSAAPSNVPGNWHQPPAYGSAHPSWAPPPPPTPQTIVIGGHAPGVIGPHGIIHPVPGPAPAGQSGSVLVMPGRSGMVQGRRASSVAGHPTLAALAALHPATAQALARVPLRRGR